MGGDLGKARLGMSDADYEHWSQEADTMIHLATDIRLTREDNSAATNLDPCSAVVDFACHNGAKPLHFFSSMGHERMVHKTLQAPLERVFSGGYGEQKWRSKQLTLRAREKAVPLRIYRLPFMASATARQPGTVPDLRFPVASIIGDVPDFSHLPMHWMILILVELLQILMLVGGY